MTAACRNCFGTHELQRQPSFEDNFVVGQIFMWSGSLEAIPDEFVFCDGTLGTPNLRNKWIRGAGLSLTPDDTGGTSLHSHELIDPGHDHTFPPPTGLQAGANFDTTVEESSLTGTTDEMSHNPLSLRLAYIMFTG